MISPNRRQPNLQQSRELLAQLPPEQLAALLTQALTRARD